jgi:hypothetical protein
MGFFDFLKKPPPEPSKVTAPAKLIFKPNGAFEIASCHGKDALKHLRQLRDEGHDSGFQVILLGGKDDADSLAENRELSETSAEENLKLAAEVNVEEWLKKHTEENLEEYTAENGEWPRKTPQQGNILAHLDILSRKPKEVVCIAKIRTSKNWEAPAYIGNGGWNGCPDSPVLTAFAKRWQERYGAEIVSITHDIMEFSVSKPPSTKEAAVELAKEQYILCSDIVNQGVGDVSTLAAALLNSDYWYFWWD